MIDFSNCEVEPLRVYDGANGKKIWTIKVSTYNGAEKSVPKVT